MFQKLAGSNKDRQTQLSHSKYAPKKWLASFAIVTFVIWLLFNDIFSFYQAVFLISSLEQWAGLITRLSENAFVAFVVSMFLVFSVEKYLLSEFADQLIKWNIWGLYGKKIPETLQDQIIHAIVSNGIIRRNYHLNMRLEPAIYEFADGVKQKMLNISYEASYTLENTTNRIIKDEIFTLRPRNVARGLRSELIKITQISIDGNFKGEKEISNINKNAQYLPNNKKKHFRYFSFFIDPMKPKSVTKLIIKWRTVRQITDHMVIYTNHLTDRISFEFTPVWSSSCDFLESNVGCYQINDDEFPIFLERISEYNDQRWKIKGAVNSLFFPYNNVVVWWDFQGDQGLEREYSDVSLYEEVQGSVSNEE